MQLTPPLHTPVSLEIAHLLKHTVCLLREGPALVMPVAKASNIAVGLILVNIVVSSL